MTAVSECEANQRYQLEMPVSGCMSIKEVTPLTPVPMRMLQKDQTPMS